MRKHLPKIRLAVYVLVAVAILWLSLSPHPYLPTKGLFSWDKAQHALAYAVLAFLGGWALLPQMGDALGAWRRGAVIAVFYGILLEFAQMFLTRVRSGQISDAVANTVGALAVYWAIRLAVSLRGSRNQPEVD